MKRRLWSSLIGVVLAVIVTLVYVIASGNTPILGLDLQGGVSVILAPTEDASPEELTVIRDQIRSELERQGIAEPDVRVQGDTIVVDLPACETSKKRSAPSTSPASSSSAPCSTPEAVNPSVRPRSDPSRAPPPT
jgi:preprotein translocase subunit SecD